jgi:cytoskeletal protein CcmA (bactofilin family)
LKNGVALPLNKNKRNVVMNKLFFLLAVGIFYQSDIFGQETLQSVTNNGNTTTQNLNLAGSDVMGPVNALNWKISDNTVASVYADRVVAAGQLTDLACKVGGPGAQVEALRIKYTGNVGIGTSNPQSKLTVKGDITATDNINLTGTDVMGPVNTLNWKINGNTVASIYADRVVAAGQATDLVYRVGDAGVQTEAMRIRFDGAIGIGTATPQSKLSVNGDITAKKVKVSQNDWADYVFDSSYMLKPLEEVADFIHANKHLPEMPSANEIEAKGLDLGDIVKQQQVKIEELTLYLIELKKDNEEQKKQNLQLRTRLDSLEANCGKKSEK